MSITNENRYKRWALISFKMKTDQQSEWKTFIRKWEQPARHQQLYQVCDHDEILLVWGKCWWLTNGTKETEKWYSKTSHYRKKVLSSFPWKKKNFLKSLPRKRRLTDFSWITDLHSSYKICSPKGVLMKSQSFDKKKKNLIRTWTQKGFRSLKNTKNN